MKSLCTRLLPMRDFPLVFHKASEGSDTSPHTARPFPLGSSREAEGLYRTALHILKVLPGWDGLINPIGSVFSMFLSLGSIFKNSLTKISLASTLGQVRCPHWCVSTEPTVETTVLSASCGNLVTVPCLLPFASVHLPSLRT